VSLRPEPKFAVVGDNCIDRFLPPVDDCLVGGNAVNVAVQLAMRGCRVQYFGAVGDDPAGQAVKRALVHKGVGVSHLMEIRGRRTAYTDIEISDDGDRSFVFEEFGACADYRPGPLELDLIKTASLVHIGWLNDRGLVKRSLAGQGVTISQDLSVNAEPENLDPAGLDLAFGSSSVANAQALAYSMIQRGARRSVVTMGASGSLCFDGKNWFSAEAPAITPEDTTGAGDAFIAGFLAAFSIGAVIEACLESGTHQAAAACLHRGGFPQEPLHGLMEPWAEPTITEL
jgi:fructoselysine 6-kinase